MAKKIQELTKELSQKSVQLYADVSKTKSAAEKLLADLKKIETGFAQKEEAAIAEQKMQTASVADIGFLKLIICIFASRIGIMPLL